jgi:hypothetical protein
MQIDRRLAKPPLQPGPQDVLKPLPIRDCNDEPGSLQCCFDLGLFNPDLKWKYIAVYFFDIPTEETEPGGGDWRDFIKE